MGEVALSHTEVKAAIYKARHIFKIRDFDRLIEVAALGKKMYSAHFGHPDTPELKWVLVVAPLGYGETDGFVSVHLELTKPPPKDQTAKITLRSGKSVWSKKVVYAGALDGTNGTRKLVPHKSIEYSEPGVFEVTAEVEYKWGEAKVITSPVAPSLKVLDHSSLLFSAKHSDFSLLVEGETIPVHKVLLASASPVFDRMFAQTNTSEFQTNSTTLRDTSPDAVKLLLRFAYTGRLRPEDQASKPTADQDGEPEVSWLCGALGLADRYDVEGLGEAVEALLWGRLDKDSLLPIAAAADLHGFLRLFQECREAVLSGRVELGSVEGRPAEDLALVCKLTAPAKPR